MVHIKKKKKQRGEDNGVQSHVPRTKGEWEE